MSLARPSKRLVAGGYQFFFDRYALASHGMKLAGMQMRSDGREAVGYLFSKGPHVFCGAHVVHYILDGDAFLDAMEKYDEMGILVPTGADAEGAMAQAYHAYQMPRHRVNIRSLLGPMRSRLKGPWVNVVLSEEAEAAGGDPHLRAVWRSISRDFRNDAVAKANSAQRVTVPTWFAAYWADRVAVSKATRGRPHRPPPRSRTPRLPVRFRL